ncbi:glycosyltransferase family 39 protein [Atlantibacter sp.]|uniref:glycosyltransferase family 39 protein n=1 Tax=Atlantibacter sp. TaxID=1903473 RepID=UPI0028A687EB|nr:glycosyltransferase family 39 protein [Atlantibacter sp.]
MKITKNIVIIIVIALLANAGLYMNAGYFSHDEIGWGLKAISAHSLADINFYNIFNYTEFHYRPLNFNLWLLTSYYLFDIPQVFHLVLLCFGIINAILIYLILRKLINYKTAFWAALLSTMMPSVVFVNGWIGTIADIFWFMFCSLSFLCFISIHSPSKSRIWLFCVSVIFFIMALMFKETAVIYPGVIFYI